MPDPIETKRSWFRFSLRTMLIVVTICTVWFGWQWNIVASRRAMKGKLHGSRDEGHWQFGLNERTIICDFSYPAIPIWRVWMGDEALDGIYLPGNAAPEEIQEAVRLFPEANIFPDGQSPIFSKQRRSRFSFEIKRLEVKAKQ